MVRVLCRLGRRICREIEYRYLASMHSWSSRFSREVGVTCAKRNPELVVSLTSIPERLGIISLCINSLLRQSLRPDRLILWLSDSSDASSPQFGRDKLEAELERLVARGLEIRWYRNIGPYRKIIPALRHFPDSLIVTADDDFLYPRHWLRLLYAAYRREPRFIHCHRAHLMRYDSSGAVLPYRQWDWLAENSSGPSFNIFPTGGGGVLYAPGQLHREVTNEEAFLSLCPKADDVWLKAMSLLTGTPCKKVAPWTLRMTDVRIPNNVMLSAENYAGDGNDRQISAVSEVYGVFRGTNADSAFEPSH